MSAGSLDAKAIAGCALDVAWYSEQAMGEMQAGAPVEVRRVLTAASGPLTS